MATGQGTVTIDFGSAPGTNEASIAFSDATIGASSKVEAYFMASDTTTDHTADDHKYIGLFVALSGEASAGVGGTIYGRCADPMEGTFKVRYVWAD